MRPHEIVDRKVVLTVKEPCAATDNLFKLDHGVYRPHQHDVTNVPCIHAGRKFLRCGEDGWNGFLIVLKVSQVLFAQFAVVGCDALAVVRVFARFQLVDEVAHEQSVGLVGAEHQRFFVLVDLLHEDLHTLFFALANLDDLVEVFFLVALASFNLPFHHVVIGRVNILVKRRLNLLHFERCEKAIVDPFLQRVDEHRLTEVAIGVHVVFAFWCGSQTELHGGREILQNASPVTFVVCAATMALVNDDEVEEVRRVVAEVEAWTLSRQQASIT